MRLGGVKNISPLSWGGGQNKIDPKNLDDEVKNQEKANNSLSYRFADIIKQTWYELLPANVHVNGINDGISSVSNKPLLISILSCQ